MKYLVNTLVVLAASLLASAGSAQCLVQNGGAEAAPASSTGLEVVFVPDWTTTGNFTAVLYGATSAFPSGSSPGPPNRGAAFFAGGPSNPFSNATQSIDVSSMASQIDLGAIQFKLSGYLGGFLGHRDHAVVEARFLDNLGTDLGRSTIGPVTTADRGGVTGLLPRSDSGLVPAGARTIDVSITMTRLDGNYNDGFADEITLELLSAPASETTRIGSPPNPGAFHPGVTMGPVIGQTWDPVIDHTTFAPAAFLDFVGISSQGSANLPTALGTLLILPPFENPIIFNASPGTPFGIPIPNDCSFVGANVWTQGGSVSPGPVIELANALDLVLGNV